MNYLYFYVVELSKLLKIPLLSFRHFIKLKHALIVFKRDYPNKLFLGSTSNLDRNFFRYYMKHYLVYILPIEIIMKGNVCKYHYLPDSKRRKVCLQDLILCFTYGNLVEIDLFLKESDLKFVDRDVMLYFLFIFYQISENLFPTVEANTFSLSDQDKKFILNIKERIEIWRSMEKGLHHSLLYLQDLMINKMNAFKHIYGFTDFERVTHFNNVYNILKHRKNANSNIKSDEFIGIAIFKAIVLFDAKIGMDAIIKKYYKKILDLDKTLALRVIYLQGNVNNKKIWPIFKDHVMSRLLVHLDSKEEMLNDDGEVELFVKCFSRKEDLRHLALRAFYKLAFQSYNLFVQKKFSRIIGSSRVSETLDTISRHIPAIHFSKCQWFLHLKIIMISPEVKEVVDNNKRLTALLEKKLNIS